MEYDWTYMQMAILDFWFDVRHAWAVVLREMADLIDPEEGS